MSKKNRIKRQRNQEPVKTDAQIRWDVEKKEKEDRKREAQEKRSLIFQKWDALKLDTIHRKIRSVDELVTRFTDLRDSALELVDDPDNGDWAKMTVTMANDHIEDLRVNGLKQTNTIFEYLPDWAKDREQRTAKFTNGDELKAIPWVAAFAARPHYIGLAVDEHNKNVWACYETHEMIQVGRLTNFYGLKGAATPLREFMEQWQAKTKGPLAVVERQLEKPKES